MCNDDRLVSVNHLYDIGSLTVEMHMELRMSLNNSFYRLAEQLRICSLWETYGRRNIIHSRSGLLHAIDIDTHLCIRQREVAHVGMLHLGSFLLGSTSTHQSCQYLVLDALHTTGLRQSLRIQRYAEALVDLYGEFDGHDRRQTYITQYSSNAKVLGIDDLCDDVVNFLLQHIHGNVAFHISSFLFGFGKGFLVHLLVLVQRNTVNLHRYSRHHVWWFLVEDEVVQRLYVHLLVTDDVSSNELSATFLIEGLHSNILNAWVLADDSLHFRKLNTETANLHLSVATTYKLDVSIRQIAHDVSGTVAAAPRRLYERLSCLLWTIQIATTHLRTVYPQFASSTHRQPMAISIHDVQMHIFHGLSNGDILHLLCHRKCRNITDTL